MAALKIKERSVLDKYLMNEFFARLSLLHEPGTISMFEKKCTRLLSLQGTINTVFV